MIYCFDIDGTLCKTEGSDYESSIPDYRMINLVNQLFDEGHHIKVFTARGSCSGIDWTVLTATQLESWGMKYHELIMNKKPHYDLLIDDKAVNVEDWIRAHGLNHQED